MDTAFSAAGVDEKQHPSGSLNGTANPADYVGVSPDDAHTNFVALERAEAKRAPTPGVTRWFVVLNFAVAAARETIRIPRLVSWR